LRLYGLLHSHKQKGTNDVFANAAGHIAGGPEYISIFEGSTGKLLNTQNYDPPLHPTSLTPTAAQVRNIWGGPNDGAAYNRPHRYLAGVAYLDGVRPSAVMARGYYTRTTLAAWDWDGIELKKRWLFDTRDMSSADRQKYENQGNHSLSVADVNGDGKDEIIYGAMVINSDGTPRFSTEAKHGDALHVGKFKLDRPGLQAVQCLESSPFGMQMYDASTGEVIWHNTAGGDTGRCLTASIDPEQPGTQSWATGMGFYATNGAMLNSSQPSNMPINMAIWWDGDTGRELFDVTGSNVDGNPTIQKITASAGTGGNSRNYSRSVPFTFTGSSTNGGSKKNPLLQADILGDWREEVILRKTDNTAIRIFTTVNSTVHTGAGAVPSIGIPTLMHDREYRLAIAWQNAGYNQPPHPGFFLGYNMNTLAPIVAFQSESKTLSRQQVSGGEQIAKPENPTRAGYTFDGWYNGSAVWDFDDGVVQSMALVARWSANPDDDDPVPVILPQTEHGNFLNAMQNAVSLQTAGDAAILVFDLKGNAVRSLKFTQGNYIVPLGDLPRGLYIVKATFGNEKKILKLTL
ncbi:MAG: InlB B-repeat-containing protein, partial [Fibromonadales bacterium]|nr:InlB B-repeat-containing protein [Fibromonadales bacterium]